MSTRDEKVGAFIKSEKQWTDEVKLLRQIALDSGLQEEFKWRLPCYSINGKNIAIIQTFKNFCALMFFQGHRLKDPKKLLKAPGENSHIARRLEFTSARDVTKAKSAIKKFLAEAVKVQDTPEKPEKKSKPLVLPVELKKFFSGNKKLKTAFEALTPGRQRHYVLHFSSAKQAVTRIARIEKAMPKILKGKGLND